MRGELKPTTLINPRVRVRCSNHCALFHENVMFLFLVIWSLLFKVISDSYVTENMINLSIFLGNMDY